MGIFSRKKTGVKPVIKTQELPWVYINSVDQLNKIIQTTFDKPVLLFKHSTRCMTSAIALKSFNEEWTTGNELCNLYFIDLLAHRDVSDEIEVLTGIKHESPQVIVLKGRDIIYDESHSAIDARRIQSALRRS